MAATILDFIGIARDRHRLVNPMPLQGPLRET
jgi:hypothetical protein